MTGEILAVTEHLVLRRMTNDDAAALAAYRSDSGAGPLPVMGDAIPRRQRPGADRRDAQRAQFAQPGVWLQIGIETSGRLIGDIAVRADCDTRNWAIAWMVAVIRACAVAASSIQGLQIGQVGAVTLAVGGELLGVDRVDGVMSVRIMGLMGVAPWWCVAGRRPCRC